MKKLEKESKNFLTERGWHKLKPSDLAKSISIESAELLELFQWTNPSLEDVKKDKEKISEIKKELADVFLYSIYMSVLLGFDTKKIILDKLEYARKKFPPSIVKNKGDKEPGTEDFYHKIKKSYRRKGLS
ncbi:MAG: nucleotide pyrophosphohydrolase [Candidatus Paceibacterota bacterium]